MYDYSEMTDEDFYRLLLARLADMTPEDILLVPGAYEVFSEELNNDVLEDWRAEKEIEQDSE